VAPAETESFLLDALAVVETGSAESLEGAELALRRPGAEGMAVAVLANLTEEDTRRLARSRGAAGRGLAIVLNTAAWDPLRVPEVLPHDTAVGLLRQAGWRVLSASATTRLPDLWRGAGRSSGASPYAASFGGNVFGSEFGR